ncbi:MAG: DMT family transporter [Betaproteobacteria bacterium]
MALTAAERAPAAPGGRGIGSLFAIVGVLGFSFKAILVKLGYAWDPSLDAVTLLTLRMIYSTPFFIVMAWWAGRGAHPTAAHDWRMLLALGFIGYYLSSLIDFVGLQYVTAALERLTLYLYPTIVVLLSAWWFGKPITRRVVLALLLSYAGLFLAFAHDLRLGVDHAAIMYGGTLVFLSAVLYAIYLVLAGPLIERLGSSRFIAWAMLASAAFVFVQFALTRPASALDLPWSIHALALAMAVLSTVLPTWLIAEAIRRIGANQSSLVGSLGPIFTIGLGATILDEPTNLLQLVGAALVLSGVMLVSARPRPGAVERE